MSSNVGLMVVAANWSKWSNATVKDTVIATATGSITISTPKTMDSVPRAPNSTFYPI